MVKILAVDPGVTTGMATFDTETKKWRRWQIGPEDHHELLWDEMREVDELVCEDFNFRPNPNRRKVILKSVEYIGVMKLYSSGHGAPLRIQLPSQAKGLWTDDKLKKLGLWEPSLKHAMDATRHMLYYLVVWRKDSSWLQMLK